MIKYTIISQTKKICDELNETIKPDQSTIYFIKMYDFNKKEYLYYYHVNEIKLKLDFITFDNKKDALDFFFKHKLNEKVYKASNFIGKIKYEGEL